MGALAAVAHSPQFPRPAVATAGLRLLLAATARVVVVPVAELPRAEAQVRPGLMAAPTQQVRAVLAVEAWGLLELTPLMATGLVEVRGFHLPYLGLRQTMLAVEAEASVAAAARLMAVLVASAEEVEALALPA